MGTLYLRPNGPAASPGRDMSDTGHMERSDGYIDHADRFHRKGVRQIKQSAQRADQFAQSAKQAGVEVLHVYWTLGAHDGVLIFEAADDETATSVLLSLASKGNVRTQTLRAFDKAAFEKIASAAS